MSPQAGTKTPINPTDTARTAFFDASRDEQFVSFPRRKLFSAADMKKKISGHFARAAKTGVLPGRA